MMAECKREFGIYYVNNGEQRVELKATIIREIPLNIVTCQGKARIAELRLSQSFHRGDCEQTITDPGGGSYTVRDRIEIQFATVSGRKSDLQDFYIAIREAPPLRHGQCDVIFSQDLDIAGDSPQIAPIRAKKPANNEEAKRQRQEHERKMAEARAREAQIRREEKEKYRASQLKTPS